MSQAQIPFENQPNNTTTTPPQARQTPPSTGPNPADITLVIIGCCAITLFAVCAAFSQQAKPEAFEWAGRANWFLMTIPAILLGFAISQLTKTHHSVARRLTGAIIFLILTALTGMLAYNSTANWNADNASGPSDATATVVDFFEDEEENDTDWVLTVRMPDESERQWTFDSKPAIDPKPGQTVDVTYYPRSNVLVAINLNE